MRIRILMLVTLFMQCANYGGGVDAVKGLTGDPNSFRLEGVVIPDIWYIEGEYKSHAGYCYLFIDGGDIIYTCDKDNKDGVPVLDANITRQLFSSSSNPNHYYIDLLLCNGSQVCNNLILVISVSDFDGLTYLYMTYRSGDDKLINNKVLVKQ